MRYSLLFPLVCLAVAGCVAVDGTPPRQTTTTTYVTPVPTTTYVTPGTSSTTTTTVRSPY
jgi:hypothetical protein